jgi:hypothetical protein
VRLNKNSTSKRKKNATKNLASVGVPLKVDAAAWSFDQRHLTSEDGFQNKNPKPGKAIASKSVLKVNPRWAYDWNTNRY